MSPLGSLETQSVPVLTKVMRCEQKLLVILKGQVCGVVSPPSGQSGALQGYRNVGEMHLALGGAVNYSAHWR